jgi:hypothetical protein
MFRLSMPIFRRLLPVLGLGAALLDSTAVAGDHFFHRRQLVATSAAAYTASVQQAVVTVPVQVGYAPAVQVFSISPSSVPLVQAPVTYSVASAQTAAVPAQAPVLNIRLETPAAPAGVAPAPQAAAALPAQPAPQAAIGVIPTVASTPATVLVSQGTVPVQLYLVPKTHTGFLRHRSIFGGK